MALDARAFIEFERAAHDRIAGRYAEVFAPLTSLALGPLLDAAQVAAGRRVLDVATGPGVAAAAAQARGAEVTGVDVSPGMIALARRAHPGVEFRVAEATALPFPADAYDAVVCNFALGHFPEPHAALAECLRVLAPGGVLAFSWWDQPARQRVQGLFREAIAELALPPPPEVPQGHDVLRYSEGEAFRRSAAACGARRGVGGGAPHHPSHAGCGGALAVRHGWNGGHSGRGERPGRGHPGPGARRHRPAGGSLPGPARARHPHRFPHRRRAEARMTLPGATPACGHCHVSCAWPERGGRVRLGGWTGRPICIAATAFPARSSATRSGCTTASA